jgi:large subunit ribosomal protein L21
VAEIVAQTKGEKIRISKFKSKSRYRRVAGHRQQLTELKIVKI